MDKVKNSTSGTNNLPFNERNTSKEIIETQKETCIKTKYDCFWNHQSINSIQSQNKITTVKEVSKPQ